MDLASKRAAGATAAAALVPILAAILAGVLAVGAAGCRRLAPTPPAAPPVAEPAAAPAPAPPPPRGTHIALLYGSDLGAAYETCGCAVQPMGGIARRATQIDRARAEADASLAVDAGNLLSPPRAPGDKPARAPGDKPPNAAELERRARLLATAYRRMGMAAFTPGARDLALGLPLLRRLVKQAHLPIVSANLRGPDGALLFEADRIVAAAGVKVGLFGVTAAPNGPGYAVGDPAAAARAEVAALRARGAALVVALVDVGPAAETRKLLAAVPGIDWAVAGGSGLRLETPESVGGARLLAAMAEGKELGRLDLHVVGGSLALADRGARAEVETILADHRRQLVDYDRRLGDTDPASLRDYYETRRHQIEEAIARETALLGHLPRQITGSWFENRLIPLDAATPDQNGVAVLVEAYKRESARLAAAGRPVGLGDEPPGAQPASPGREPAAPPTAPPLFLGTPTCGGCHAPALAFWKTTKHARALGALARIGRNRDPSCVGCHVTGYVQPGGWRLDARAAASAPLENVGCEACHGPGLGHPQAADKTKGTARAVPVTVCLGCHTADITGGELDYPRLAAAIVGPGHGRPGVPAGARP